MQHIIVVGGVVSGIGKGVGAASIALLLKMRGLRVQVIKLDPYLNINAGILSPREHGETFLCDDGTECDLDIGHYSRLANIEVSQRNIYTAGMVYEEIINEQKEGKYLGQTIQVIPHVTDKIMAKFDTFADEADITIVEIGGTIGDLESSPYLKAVRQFKQKRRDDVMIVMVSPILWMPTIKEFKTKPLQKSVEDLQTFGLQPDMLLCRSLGYSDRAVDKKILQKIASATDVPPDSVFEAPDVKSIYQIPIGFYDRHVDDLIADKFHLRRNGVRIHKYRDLVERYINAESLAEITIGIIGKYENCDEAYLSLKEAIYHAAVENNVNFQIRWIAAEDFEKTKDPEGIAKFFEGLAGVIVPGGFDCRGVEGKVKAIRYARENRIPFLGICLGLQCAVIEFARSIGLEGANSIEFDPKTANPVIHFVAGQESIRNKCGTMRLGAFDCALTKDSLARSLYGKKTISERHRHRYEVNSSYEDQFAEHGFHVSGVHPDTGLIEVMELSRDKHPFFIGTQAHPEFKSRLGEPSPLFAGLVSAAADYNHKCTSDGNNDATN